MAIDPNSAVVKKLKAFEHQCGLWELPDDMLVRIAQHKAPHGFVRDRIAALAIIWRHSLPIPVVGAKPKRHRALRDVFMVSRHFVRTRLGFYAAPSVAALGRHVEANMQLYRSVMPEGDDTRFGRFAFWLSRLVLAGVSETVQLCKVTVRKLHLL